MQKTTTSNERKSTNGDYYIVLYSDESGIQVLGIQMVTVFECSIFCDPTACTSGWTGLTFRKLVNFTEDLTCENPGLGFTKLWCHSRLFNLIVPI